MSEEFYKNSILQLPDRLKSVIGNYIINKKRLLNKIFGFFVLKNTHILYEQPNNKKHPIRCIQVSKELVKENCK